MSVKRILDRDIFVKLSNDDRIDYLRYLTFTSQVVAQYAGMTGSYSGRPERKYSDHWRQDHWYNGLNLVDVFDNAAEILTHAHSHLIDNLDARGLWPYESYVQSIVETVKFGQLRSN